MPLEARVIWMTGLSGAGKSTLAHAVSHYLNHIQRPCVVLDGDDLRRGINRDLSFSPEDRNENIRRAAYIADLIRRQGIWCIAAMITPLNNMRQLAADIIGRQHFRLVYVKAPIEVCISRDPKKLYAKAIAGEIKDFTGISAPFEEPLNPHLIIDTSDDDLKICTDRLIQFAIEDSGPNTG